MTRDQTFFIHVWLVTTIPLTTGTRPLDIDHCRGELEVVKRETRADRQHLPVTGDHGITIIDGTPCLVSQQVGIDVTDLERPGSFQHETPPDLLLAKSKMAGTRIEDDIDPSLGKTRPCTIRNPGILANLKTQPDPVQVEDEVPDRVCFLSHLDGADIPSLPGLEPAGLVVQAIPRQVLLGSKTQGLAIGDQTGSVEKSPGVPGREAKGDNDSAGMRNDLLQQVECQVLNSP